MSDQYELASSEQTRFIKRPNGRYCIWNEHETVDELNALYKENQRLRYLEKLAEELIAKNRKLVAAGNAMVKRLEEAGDLCLSYSFKGMHVMAGREWCKAKEAKP